MRLAQLAVPGGVERAAQRPRRGRLESLRRPAELAQRASVPDAHAVLDDPRRPVLLEQRAQLAVLGLRLAPAPMAAERDRERELDLLELPFATGAQASLERAERRDVAALGRRPQVGPQGADGPDALGAPVCRPSRL